MISSDLAAHQLSDHHVNSLKDAELFKSIFEKRTDGINLQLDKDLKTSLKITRNSLV